MKLSRMFALTSVCTLGLIASPLFAEEAATKVCAESGTCPVSGEVDAALAKLPQMTFLVGDQETTCSRSAGTMAEAAGKPVQYKVGDQAFDTKEEAFTTLVTRTEEMVSKFTTPSTCKVSGKTTIAGKSCNCPIEAGTMAKKVQAATQLVSMKYQVGDETCSCPNSAAAMAKKAGVKTTFVVDGTETQCEMTARLALARAKYKAAVKALASAAPAKAGSDS